MREKRKYDLIESIVVNPCCGAELTEVCWQAAILAREIGCRAKIVHSNTVYEMEFRIENLGPVEK